jgi:hypothetical protein
MKALDGILDEAFVYVEAAGRRLTKAEVLAGVEASHGLRVSSESMVVPLHGDTPVVTRIYQLVGAERGKLLVRRERLVDTWWYRSRLRFSIASLTTPCGS